MPSVPPMRRCGRLLSVGLPPLHPGGVPALCGAVCGSPLGLPCGRLLRPGCCKV
nr:MAG TPA: hypothetical protein [Caudoviricetes sp.]